MENEVLLMNSLIKNERRSEKNKIGHKLNTDTHSQPEERFYFSLLCLLRLVCIFKLDEFDFEVLVLAVTVASHTHTRTHIQSNVHTKQCAPTYIASCIVVCYE